MLSVLIQDERSVLVYQLLHRVVDKFTTAETCMSEIKRLLDNVDILEGRYLLRHQRLLFAVRMNTSIS